MPSAGVLRACVVLLQCLGSTGKTVELSPETFDEVVFGGAASSFIKFFAPWCGHCQALAPAWDELAAVHANIDDIIIGEVDCTTEDMKGLCERFKINGYPTLKFVQAGDAELQDFEEQDTSAPGLLEFARSNLKPACTPTNRVTCDATQLELLEKMLAMPAEERAAEYRSLASPLEQEQAKLTTLEERLEKLEEKVEEQEDIVDNLKKHVGAKLRLVRSTLEGPVPTAASAPASDKDEV